MKGRRISDETARIVRELRRRGLSLRKIAQRARISKTSVYRLTKGISWEQHPVQPELAQADQILERGRPEQAVRPIALPEPQVPRAKMGTLDEEKSGLDQLRVCLMQNRILCPVRPEQAAKQQSVCLTVQDSEESELDEAEAYVRRMRFASKLYEQVDFLSLLEAMESKDPLGEYRELRKKTLSLAVIMLRINRMFRSRHSIQPG